MSQNSATFDAKVAEFSVANKWLFLSNFGLTDLFSIFGLPPFCQNEASIYRITQALKRLIY